MFISNQSPIIYVWNKNMKNINLINKAKYLGSKHIAFRNIIFNVILLLSCRNWALSLGQNYPIYYVLLRPKIIKKKKQTNKQKTQIYYTSIPSNAFIWIFLTDFTNHVTGAEPLRGQGRPWPLCFSPDLCCLP